MIDKTLPLLILLACSTQEGPPPDHPAVTETQAGTSAPRVADAERLMRAGDVDAALLITDSLLERNPDDRAALVAAARGNIALFKSGRQGSEWFLDDAIRNLVRALNLDPEDAQAMVTLSWCKLRKSEFEEGSSLAIAAAELLRAQEAPPGRIAEALMQGAENQMQILVAARRTELDEGSERPGDGTKALANRVLSTLKTAQQYGAMTAAHVRGSQVYQWMGRTNEAVGELEIAVRGDPSSAEANDALQNLYWGMDMRAECAMVYKRLLKESPGSTAVRWYLGRAQVALGDDMRRKTRWDGAGATYQDALETFTAYDEAKPGDHAGTSQWIAICELSLGRVEFEQGRLDVAKRHYFAAFDANPRVADYDESRTPEIFDSFGGNYLGGLSLIGQVLAEQTDDGALRRSLDYFEEILAKHPGRFGTIYNNAALSARDLGVQAAGAEGPTAEASADDATRRARLAEAMRLWETSYAYYQKAVELEPLDPRIINDCGLMLIYYLHRDYDQARGLCEKAIAIGEQQLAALPEDATDAQRNDLEEAIGDAYQNIGVLLQDRLSRGAEEWRPMYDSALKYYPYQRREAAARLRMEASQASEQDPRKKKFDVEIEKGKVAAAAGDYDGALLVIDGLAKEMNGYAPFHRFAGAWSLAYAKKAASGGGNPGLIDGLFSDAVRNLRRAVELDGDPLEPRLELAEALLAQGDAAGANEVATALLGHARSVGGAPREFLVRAHAARAQAAARAFVAAKQAGETDEELLRSMRTSFREIEATDAFSQQDRALWVATEQWAGAAEQAVQVMVRAWERDPNLIGELVQTGAQAGASQAVVDALVSADDATSLWWRGRAHFDLGVQLWSAGKAKEGLVTLDAGVALFERSMRDNEGFRDSCQQWIALSLGQKGVLQISLNDYEAAETTLIDAVERRPDVFTSDLGGGQSIKRAILIVGDAFFRQRDLGRVAAIYRKVGAAVPDDVDVANNEGLFCRDHADALARADGASETTADLYEASYAAYTRASELDPGNVRLRNDRALILVYSLKRDLELAEQILKSAIADGQRQLDEDPPEDSTELRDLQEAVGDAFGNLGVLYFERKDYPQAREALTESLDYYPFQQRAGARMLRRIDEIEKQAAGGGKKDGQ